MLEMTLSQMRTKIPPQGRGQGTAIDCKSFGHFVDLKSERAGVLMEIGFLVWVVTV